MTEHGTTLAAWLGRFLLDYIVTERRLARNTQKSYRDTFVLLLPLVGKKARKTLERLHVEDITAARVLAFLDHLENDRNCSVQTRNQRLTAIRSFARFVASRDPARLAWCSQVRAISAKKVVPQPVSWMSREEIDALLRVPDRTTPRGQVEHALLLFLVNTGARVSEATELRIRDLEFDHSTGKHAIATIHGKGGKTRKCRSGRAPRQSLPNS